MTLFPQWPILANRLHFFKKEKQMSGGTYKLIELVGTSKESFEDAVNNAVKEAAKTIKNMAWLEVVEQRGHIADGEVSEYQVKVKLSFKIKRS